MTEWTNYGLHAACGPNMVKLCSPQTFSQMFDIRDFYGNNALKETKVVLPVLGNFSKILRIWGSTWELWNLSSNLANFRYGT